MTSSEGYVGMETISKPTSRVLAPPGGKTSFSLGGYGEDPEPVTGKPASQEADAEKQQAQKQAEQDLYKPLPQQPIRPAVGLNPVTGQPNRGGPLDPALAADEPSPGVPRSRAKPQKLDPASMPAAGGRVESRAPIKKQPPGGKDSGIFS